MVLTETEGMNGKKLIFFDIDGTLLTEGKVHRVPESTTEALNRLRANGHICMINTGRPYASLDKHIKSIPVDGYVCGCGTNIRLGEKVILSVELEQDVCTRIARELDRSGCEWLLEAEYQLFYSPMTYRSFLGGQIASLKNKVTERIRVVRPEEYDRIRFTKFVMIQPDLEAGKKFREKFRNELEFIDRGRFMWECVPKGYSKATGMKACEEAFGIPHEDTIAVGDSANDVSMLEYAATGVLMGNGDPALREMADLVTADIEEDGIWKAFVKLGMIEG